ncbi:hypothetical protein SPRG_18997 [Saprolegnia parasitica CBS 223.65]|uniref:FYVE-type domain-containing protein n=1 Tax=Saprolegnia parasitica (strain CBS 223.65) TaxID=695850 RepID=A0A067CUG8_SAPPC|nr:hypothetical protein SPRG_18997 [Saprolegnia parasitica CBS 223.65]KDO34143.1 hypothetical protein SPRG_18997 [Saprolegnia parasitica CBS 223.65]|eukprot:XP_012195199.1 hypothetical protein SPRG_18997 [Saprolegnia parasitica CBS 223.65]
MVLPKLEPADLLSPSAYASASSCKGCTVCLRPFSLLAVKLHCILCGEVVCQACTQLASVETHSTQGNVCAPCYGNHPRLFGRYKPQDGTDECHGTGPRKWPSDQRFIRTDQIAAARAARADCARCRRPFPWLDTMHGCVTCGDHYCSECTLAGLALRPDGHTSHDVRVCTTCAMIAIVDGGSYEQCKVLLPQIRALFHAPDFPSNTTSLDPESVLRKALDLDTKAILSESGLATEDALVSLYERNFCGSCGSWGRFLLTKRHCAVCGDVVCARCLLSKLAATLPVLSTVRAVPECFQCNAKQCFGPNPWLPAAPEGTVLEP